MRILHLCLACFYIDGYSYQENILPRINKEDGNDVMIIASTETFIDNKILGYVEPRRYITEYGVPIVRLPYKGIGIRKTQSKLRKYSGLYSEIEQFNPDVIMAHDLCFSSVKDVIKYVKRHESVKFYADTHTAEYNSGKNWISLNILHRIIYRSYVKQTIPYIDKYFYLSTAERDFSIRNYKFPIMKMEFYPLGGFPLDDDVYKKYRDSARKEYGVDANKLLFVHSGKLNKAKKSIELIKAFESINNSDIRLIIVGSVSDDIRDEFERLLLADKRISFVGWKNAEQLQHLLCAADLYLQPGSVSSTMQNAICCRCPIMSYPHESYLNDFDYGQFIWVTDETQMVEVFNKITNGEYDLSLMSSNAEKCAVEVLDYNVLAARLYK